MSLTVNRKIYVPSTRPEIAVVAEDLAAIVNELGPLNLVHAYDTIDPSASDDAEPFNVAEFEGNVIVMFAPAIPGLNDHEMEAVLERSAQAGARGAGYVALRLPMEIKDLFQEWLATDHPDRASRVMSLVRQIRGGKDYDSQWGKRMKGEGPIAALMSRRFAVAKTRYGLAGRLGDMDLTQFRVPPKSGSQIDLFG